MTTLAAGGPGPAAVTGAAGRGHSGTRLRLHRNPLRVAWSAAPWSAAGYLGGYLLVGGLLFSIAFTAATTAAVLAITIFGIPLLAAAAGVVRGCANIERGRLRQVLTEPVRGRYEAVTRLGIVAQATTRWRDPATWRDVAYLIGLWVPLTILDAVVFGIWAWFLSWITVPAWYWAPWISDHGSRLHGYQLGFYFPHGPDGPGTIGLFVDTLPKALGVAAAGLAGFLLFNYVLVVTARMHARVARSLLRPPGDPLAEAKGVLSGPGPLGSLT